MMRKDSRNDDLYGNSIPKEMLEALSFEGRINGQWKKLGEIDNNRTRLIKLKFDTIKTTAVRIKMTKTYGTENVKLFEVRCYA